CAVRGPSNLLDCPHGLYIDAVHRANFGALVANNAIIDLIMEAIASVVWNGYRFVGILNGRDAFYVREVLAVHDGNDLAFAGSTAEVSKRQHQSVRQRSEGNGQVAEVRVFFCCHAAARVIGWRKNSKKKQLVGLISV